MKILSNLKAEGFTLAEVLITLTIIGVVAALTIPALLANVNDKTYDAKRKGLATRMAQAIAQIDAINAYEDETDAEANSSMKFVVEALSKAYKISNVCEFENFSACDFPATTGIWYTNSVRNTRNYPYLNNYVSSHTADKFGGLLTKAAAFKTRNGESILLYYNPRCISEQDVDSENKKIWSKEVCAYMVVDLDGSKKGPNTIGKDITYGLVLYPDTPYFVLINSSHTGYPGGSIPSYSTSTSTNATVESLCKNSDNDYNYGMAKGTLSLPSREEIYTLHLAGWICSDNVWSSTIEGSGPDDYGWMIDCGSLTAKLVPRTTKSTYQACILKD